MSFAFVVAVCHGLDGAAPERRLRGLNLEAEVPMEQTPGATVQAIPTRKQNSLSSPPNSRSLFAATSRLSEASLLGLSPWPPRFLPWHTRLSVASSWALRPACVGWRVVVANMLSYVAIVVQVWLLRPLTGKGRLRAPAMPATQQACPRGGVDNSLHSHDSPVLLTPIVSPFAVVVHDVEVAAVYTLFCSVFSHSLWPNGSAVPRSS